MARDFNEPYARYLESNPGATFAEYYVDFVEGVVQSGKIHNSIGTACKNPEAIEQQAQWVLARLQDLGMCPDDYCVDMGCGSLGNAGPLMEFLKPGHYVGSDLTEKFWTYGKARFDADFLDARQPVFLLLDDAYEAKLAPYAPGFGFSIGVVEHIPAQELGVFFRRFVTPLVRGGRGFFSFTEGPSSEQVNARGFAYTRDDMAVELEKVGAAELKTVENCVGEHMFFFERYD